MFQALQWKDDMDRKRRFVAQRPKAHSSLSKITSLLHRMVGLTSDICTEETKRDSSL